MKNPRSKILHIDCSGGAGGDMALAAFFSLGVDFSHWLETMKSLPLDPFPELVVHEDGPGTPPAFRFEVREKNESAPARTLPDIEKIVGGSGLPGGVRDRSLQALRRLAACEGRIHGMKPEEVHFHELSGVDTIIDVCGAFLAVDMLSIGEVTASAVNVGSGTVDCAHGVLPVPAPATAALLEGAHVFSDGDGELTTPTGALIVTGLAAGFCPLPPMKLLATGSGAGWRDYGNPPVGLRMFMGEKLPGTEECRGGAVPLDGLETIYHLSTNIDDVEPRVAGYVTELLLEKGALDAYTQPVYMKKNRPGIVLNVLCDEEFLRPAADIIMRETTTLGVRVQAASRICMHRRMTEVDTPHGRIRVKVGEHGGEVLVVNPEYEDCALAARDAGVPLAEVFAAARRAAEDVLKHRE